MYTSSRFWTRSTGLLLFFFLALACKEEIPRLDCQLSFILDAQGDTTFTFSYLGDQLLQQHDLQARQIRTYQYGPAGLARETLLTESLDQLTYWEYQYDAANRLLSVEAFEPDTNNTWQATWRVSYQYQGGRLRGSQTFLLAAGGPQQISESAFEFDAAKSLVEEIRFEAHPQRLNTLRVAAAMHFAYDAQLNPFADAGSIFLPQGPHNLTWREQTLFIYSAGGDTSRLVYQDSLVYTYDQQGFAQRKDEYLFNGQFLSQQWGYLCEEIP